MSTTPLVSIIIVNWNGLNHLRDCIHSLKSIYYKHIEIIISDNGSTDGSIEYIKKIKKEFKKVIFIENKKNLGFAEGNNVGVKAASGKYILFLNNDAIVSKDFLGPLVKTLEIDVSIAAVQPKILCFPQKNIIDSVGSYFTYTGFLYHFGHNKRDQVMYSKSNEIFSMKGACMLFRADVLQKIGVFDANYFAYFEETDLCHRVWLSGWRIMYLPTVEIYHKGGQTAKKLPSSFVQYHSYKNRIYSYLKNCEMPTIWKLIPAHLLLCEFASFMYVVTGKFQLAWCIQKAIMWNIFQGKKLYLARQRINKLRKISDDRYLSRITRKIRLSYYYHLFATSLAGYSDE